MKCGPALLEDIFTLKEYHGPSLRSESEFCRPNINTVHYGEDSLRHFGSLIWDLIHDITGVDSLEEFKSRVRKWSPDKCPCRLCKNFIEGLGYVDLFD